MTAEALRRIGAAGADHVEPLRLAGLGLTEVPDELRRLVRLRGLDLSDNRLAELPPWIGELIALESLLLRGNQLTTLPAGIAGLHGLTVLDLAANRLVQLPAALALLPRLELLELGGNPGLLSPSLDAVDQGQAAVLSQVRAQGTGPPENPPEKWRPPSSRMLAIGAAVAGLCAATLRIYAVTGSAPTSPSRPIPASFTAIPVPPVTPAPDSVQPDPTRLR